MHRRRLVLAATATLAAPTLVRAVGSEQAKVAIAVGGRNLLYYLPLTIAERLGSYKAEGLDVEIESQAGHR
jgi:NitT/TauT family transport system substrate-binding protein